MSLLLLHRIPRFCAVLCAALGGLMNAAAHAAPTTLDTSFGNNGLVGATITSGVFDLASASAQQSDGKLVVAGSCLRPGLGSQQICVWRFQVNGTLDTNFGSAGIARIDFPGVDAEQRAGNVSMQPDGKILVAGVCNIGPAMQQPVNQFCVARLLPSGALDTQGFAINGLWQARLMPGSMKSDEQLRTMLLQPDGRIRLVGTCGVYTQISASAQLLQNYACHTRLNRDGQIDASYTPEQFENVNTLQFGETSVLLADGTVVLAGTCRTPQMGGGAFDYRGCVAQLSASGSVVRSFGSNGFSVANEPSGQSMAVTAMAVQGSGNVLVGGKCFATFSSSNHISCLRRWSASGVADSGFPVARSPSLAPYAFQLRALAVQGDGKIVAGGDCPLNSGVTTFVCAARSHANGSADVEFINADAALIPISARPDQFAALTLQADGKIVLAVACGAEQSALGISLCMARLVGGPNEFSACSGDIDGDGEITITDSLLFTRVALGFTQTNVTQNIAFASHAQRKTWPQIRDYLANHCGVQKGRSESVQQ